jgi:DNA-binding HxlR family transcriptional regulator
MQAAPQSRMDTMTTAGGTPVARMVEDIVGCKWSLAVLGAVRGGVVRPGAIEHAIDGLSKKVMNERLAKLVRYGILSKTSWPERPPRVEYALTPFGERFCALLEGIDALQREVAAGEVSPRPPPRAATSSAASPPARRATRGSGRRSSTGAS